METSPISCTRVYGTLTNLFEWILSQGLRPLPPAPTLGKRAAWRGLCCASSSALLSLLVVGCFECFGFPVKCPEASCFLEVVFYGFSNPEDHFARLGTPERTMEGNMGAQNQIFCDFG